MIELRHLKMLVALSETGNLSKAGRRLNLSQPAVSHQVRAIEQSYAIEPGWTVQPYLDRNYVAWKPVGNAGLHSPLYAATAHAASSQAYMQEFLRIMREVSFATLERIEPLQPARGRANRHARSATHARN